MTERSALEEQRDFLVRSLADLEREHEAGDVDEADYRALRDDYTARAAATLRALGSVGTDTGMPVSVPIPTERPRRWLTALVLVVIALLAGVLVAQASGRRDPGDTATGSIRQDVRQRLLEARVTFESGEYADAVAEYDAVLDDEPTNVEAQVYRGWALYVSGAREDGFIALAEAARAAPDYPDVHAFLAVVFRDLGRLDNARQALERMDALEPSPEMVSNTCQLREQLDLAVASTTTTTPGCGGT